MPTDPGKQPNASPFQAVKNLVPVPAGKGAVGKDLLSHDPHAPFHPVNLAGAGEARATKWMLERRVYGPNVADIMLGTLQGTQATADKEHIIPVASKGLKIDFHWACSIRGDKKRSGAETDDDSVITQFLRSVGKWGEIGLLVLIIDLRRAMVMCN